MRSLPGPVAGPYSDFIPLRCLAALLPLLSRTPPGSRTRLSFYETETLLAQGKIHAASSKSRMVTTRCDSLTARHWRCRLAAGVTRNNQKKDSPVSTVPAAHVRTTAARKEKRT